MVSVIPNHIAAFIISINNGLYRKYSDDDQPDTKWSGWADVGGSWMAEPVTIKRIDGEANIFMIDPNHALQHATFNFLAGHGLTPWKNLGGKLLGPPAVANSQGTIHIFHIGTDRALHHNSWDGTNYTPFERVGGMFIHRPAAVSTGENQVTVFAVGLKDGLLHYYDWQSSSGWATVTKLPGLWAETPSAVSDQAGCWDVFGIDPNGKINHISNRNGKLSGLETIDSPLLQTVDAVSWGSGRIDLIGWGLDSAIHHNSWDNNSWGKWENLGGMKFYRPTPVSHSPGALCVLGIGKGSIMHIRVRDPRSGVWGPWTNIEGLVINRVG